ncbi:TPA: hypothetical protein ACSI7A_001681, partial [Neisseria meningitidis]
NAVLVFVNPLYLELVLLFAQFYVFKRLQLVVCHKGLLGCVQVGKQNLFSQFYTFAPAFST